MVQQIPSGEVFGNVQTNLGSPPAHTSPEHLKCAYYHLTGDPVGPDLVCPHQSTADGAFYSEDYFKQIREQFNEIAKMWNQPDVKMMDVDQALQDFAELVND